jgi:hypothetical protein
LILKGVNVVLPRVSPLFFAFNHQSVWRSWTTKCSERKQNFGETVSPFFKQNPLLLQKYFLQTVIYPYLLKMKLLRKIRLKFWGNYSVLLYVESDDQIKGKLLKV